MAMLDSEERTGMVMVLLIDVWDLCVIIARGAGCSGDDGDDDDGPHAVVGDDDASSS